MVNPWVLGIADRASGLAFRSNPYQAGTQFAAEWERGWLYQDARYGPRAWGCPVDPGASRAEDGKVPF